MSARKPKDSTIREQFEYYEEQLIANKGSPSTLKKLADDLRNGIARLRKFSSQPTCPDELKDRPLAIGLFPANQEEWWRYQQQSLQSDTRISEELLSRYEVAIKSAGRHASVARPATGVVMTAGGRRRRV